MLSFTKKEQIVILLLVIAIIFTIGYNVINKKNSIEIIKSSDENGIPKVIDKDEDYSENSQIEEKREKSVEEKIIMVHISGEVHNPGLVVLNKGDRLINAVEKAGGLKKEADINKINLAKKLDDEEKIYIPKIGEVTENLSVLNNNINESHEVEENNGKINLNTASKEQLKNLPGIGDVLADRIIEYRKKKDFESIDELTNVSGIGEKKLESIRELIIVN